MVILLDLHSNAITPCGDYSRQKQMPDSQSVAFWQFVADRYKSNPLVAFDLYNEPHDVTGTVWRDGGTVTTSVGDYQTPGMQALYDTVRSTGANNLVFVSGNGYATWYPQGYELKNTKNTVWAVHDYTCPTGAPEEGNACFPGPGGVLDPSTVLDRWATVGQTSPVMVTEFGYPDRSKGDYVTNVNAYAANHGWVGWNVFVFDNTTTSDFDLVKDVGPTWNPAQSGMGVMTAIFAG
jgi:hypothetical protein